MPRQNRIDFPGALHHIIVRGIARQPIFKIYKNKQDFYNRLKKLLSKNSIKCYAWCIMDTHAHFLFQSGKTGISELMRRLLTGYALHYNKRHKRIGHLFHNRYKSILCDKDEYFLSLIRYIHLNPIKSNMVSLKGLDAFQWTGHQELIREEKGIIEKEEVLEYFGQTYKRAIDSYKKFIQEGLCLKENYEGGGLIRSGGSLSEVMARKKDEREMYDDRILGNGDFVSAVLDQYDASLVSKNIFDFNELRVAVKEYFGLGNTDHIKTRTKANQEARDIFTFVARTYLHKSLVSIGRELNINRSAVCMAVRRVSNNKELIQKAEKILN